MHKEVRKIHVKRFFQKCGVALLHYYGYRRFVDASFYPNVVALGPKAVVLDVGGNVGQTAVDFRLSFPLATIHSFEPFPSTYELLQETAGRHHFNAHKLAFGETNETVVAVSLPEPGSKLNSLVADAAEKKPTADEVPIKVQRLDGWLESQGIGQVDILKVDTEGFDLKVLAGASNTLKQQKIRNLIVEVGLSREDPNHCHMLDMVELLKPYGYRMANLFDVVHGAGNELAYCNALFLPEGAA